MSFKSRNFFQHPWRNNNQILVLACPAVGRGEPIINSPIWARFIYRRSMAINMLPNGLREYPETQMFETRNRAPWNPLVPKKNASEEPCVVPHFHGRNAGFLLLFFRYFQKPGSRIREERRLNYPLPHMHCCISISHLSLSSNKE